MKRNVIWQRCPKCGKWCKADFGLIANMAKGYLDSKMYSQKIGKSVGGVFGEKGKEIGGQVGEYVTRVPLGILNVAKEMIENDNFFFDCECGNFWSTKDPNDKQNAEYAVELAQEFLTKPYLQRKHLYICDELGLIPQSFCVLSKSSVPPDLEFPTGHPIGNTLYVCHPYRQNHYLPYDTYEIELLRDELREFKRIMKKLGAKHIDYRDFFKRNEESKKSFNRKFEGSGDNIKYQANGTYENEIQSEIGKNIQTEFEESWDGLLTKEKPMLPDDLVWYYHRPDWKEECESRLEGRTIHKSFTISVSSSEITSEQEREQINAELKVLHSASGSGSFKSTKSLYLKKNSEMAWKVNVDFYSLSDYENEPDEEMKKGFFDFFKF